ncbi:MAG: ABC transporter ATP-binding protein [Clostridium sp.]|nr:ABC transporter ATP-binding protein [Clostridium sp.]
MIKFEKVEKYYDKNRAVSIEELHVKKGEVFGFLGPNGAGKTTTIKMLVGLLSITKGNITINNYNITKQPKKAKSEFAYIPDTPDLYDKLTGKEFVRFIANLYGIKDDDKLDEEIDEILEKLEIKEKGDSLIESYSHGMKQKIQVASALIHKPNLLVLDEPFVGLDPSGVKILKDILREYAANGKTVFISTHVLDIVENLCDRITVIQKGNIKYTGTIQALKEKENYSTLEDSFLELTDGYK